AVLVQVAQIASVAIENARLYETAVDARSRLSRAARVERLRAAELHAVIQAIGEAVLVCDAAGTVTLTNPAADRLFADDPVRSADDLLSRFDLSTPDDPLLAAVEVRRRTRPELWVEIRGYAVPGLQTRVDARAEPVDPAGTIYVIRDVTAARAMRAQREAFLGILSHELRTPITTIYAGSKVLTREAGLSREGRLELAADISAEAERLYRLVEDLLVMTRAERGVLELVREPVLLQHVVTSAVRLETAHRPGLRIERTGAHDVPAVAGDATYIEQVVRNLLSNAAKYGPAGAPVQLDVASDDREVSVRVLDRGSGFKTAESDDLFELFYRSPATAAQRAGAGIGLFVCRRLVQAMGGRIWARPRAGGGAEFGFALPQFAED
ncbi:MAG: ATP-binding protein, partial [Chloroflexota bacterium]